MNRVATLSLMLNALWEFLMNSLHSIFLIYICPEFQYLKGYNRYRSDT